MGVVVDYSLSFLIGMFVAVLRTCFNIISNIGGFSSDCGICSDDMVDCKDCEESDYEQCVKNSLVSLSLFFQCISISDILVYVFTKRTIVFRNCSI